MAIKKIIVDWNEETGFLSLPPRREGGSPYFLDYVNKGGDYKIEEAGGVDLAEVNEKLDELLRRGS